jgi:hypothetical protein
VPFARGTRVDARSRAFPRRGEGVLPASLFSSSVNRFQRCVVLGGSEQPRSHAYPSQSRASPRPAIRATSRSTRTSLFDVLNDRLNCRLNDRLSQLPQLVFKTGEKIVAGISTDKRMFTGISPTSAQLSAASKRSRGRKN